MLTFAFVIIHSPPSENEAQSAYNELFQDTSLEVDKSLSKEERERLHLVEEKSLIYGEVEFKSFYRILRKINPRPDCTFYDLGSGTGKAVYAARFTQDFGKCIGIEILHGLHNQAFKITHRYNSEFRNILCSSQRQHAAVYRGSFVEYDWSDGDVVFANSTCFDDDLMHALSEQAEQLKPGAIIVTFTKGLSPSSSFEMLERKKEKMSWGPATVYIHRRLNLDGSSFSSGKLNTLPSDDQEYDEQDFHADDLSDSDGESAESSFASSDVDFAPTPSRPSNAELLASGQASPRRSSGLDDSGLNSPQDSALQHRKALRGAAWK